MVCHLVLHIAYFLEHGDLCLGLRQEVLNLRPAPVAIEGGDANLKLFVVLTTFFLLVWFL